MIYYQKNRKKLLKLIDDFRVDFVMNLFNSIYTIIKQCLSSSFDTIPKQSVGRECSEYIIIALMNHSLKTVHDRIFKILEYIGRRRLRKK